ncbi:unnamed protein product [Vitrella brassicaformis CCMP3155]|uniref:Uncharacterized protein n=1 Tax=Vitrella brassicaformis (strain CCMP3155) TaxID=1169540 RepID=A0A0G4G647_VITBC|nr:unnamed protein product [Vitrella brassicaformis CCMP3155]|eukprot:CEM23912.1 unnamed protein product [Vitrella brassicaformis CCMP3155]
MSPSRPTILRPTVDCTPLCAYLSKRPTACGAALFVLLAIVVPLSLPGWRASDQRVFLEDGHAEVSQHLGLFGYRLSLDIVGEGSTILCRPHVIEESPVWEAPQELQQCFGNNTTCGCWASYSFLVDQSTAEGDDKAAAVWRGYKRAGTFVYISMGLVLPLLMIVGGICWSRRLDDQGLSTFPWDAIGASLFTAAFCLPIVTFSAWLGLTNYRMCFDEASSSLEGGHCPAALPPYWMLGWSCLFLGVLVTRLWWCVAVEWRKAHPRVSVQVPTAPSVGRHVWMAGRVIGKARNAQDSDSMTVTTAASSV